MEIQSDKTIQLNTGMMYLVGKIQQCLQRKGDFFFSFFFFVFLLPALQSAFCQRSMPPGPSGVVAGFIDINETP